MINVLQSMQKVANKLQDVEINDKKINEFSESISSDDLDEFTSSDDTSLYRNVKVGFYKRAQLNS